MTDSELMNALTKDGLPITEAELDKTLLDLEIYGLGFHSCLEDDE
jgi:hypothetical protein